MSCLRNEMKIATLTPTRDRAKLFEFCKEQLDLQRFQPQKRYYISFDPVNDQPDITKRIKQGYELAKKDGMDWIVIVEDDDAYRVDHIALYYALAALGDKYDFIGDQNSLYYNIKTKRWRVFAHPRRASLFTTAFRVSAMEKFKWPPDNTVFLDIKIWQFAKNYRCKFIDSGAIGIKGHGFGRHGGKGHTMELKHEDPSGDFLKSKVSSRHFEFYSDLMKEPA